MIWIIYLNHLFSLKKLNFMKFKNSIKVEIINQKDTEWECWMKGNKRVIFFFGDYFSCWTQEHFFERKSEKGFAPLSAFEMENGAMNRKRKCVGFIFHLNASPLAAQRKTSQQKTRLRIRPQVTSLPPRQIQFETISKINSHGGTLKVK